MRSHRLPYHKAASGLLATRRFTTLFMLCTAPRPAAWERLKALAAHFPYVGYLPDRETGDLPPPGALALPTGARECLLIDELDLSRDECMALARSADRAGMRPFGIVQRGDYRRIGRRAGEL